MSNNTFGLICFGIIALWPLSWMVLAFIYPKSLVHTNLRTTAPKNIAEYYTTPGGRDE